MLLTWPFRDLRGEGSRASALLISDPVERHGKCTARMLLRGSASSHRTPQACQTCRRRKTKCNGVRPRCGHCSSRDVPCEWPKGAFGPTYLNRLENYMNSQDSTFNPIGLGSTEATQGDLPSRRALQRCLKYFFQQHFKIDFCSFFYKPQFEEAALLQPFLTTAIVSLCSRYLSVEEARADFGKDSPHEVCLSYTSLAKRFARDNSDHPSVSNIQANLVLSLSELLSDNGSSHWMYAGTAIRMAQIMRLNKEYHQNHSEQEREIRRRTFWACLQLDRMLAFYLVKPRTLSLRNISIALPGNDVSLAYGEKSRATTLESLQTFSGTISEIGLQPYLIKSLCLWSDLADFHVTQERMVSTLLPTNPSSRFAQLSSSLQSWENILPPRIQWSEENYRIHLDLDSGGVYLAIHCLLKSARCVSYQDYLPQTDGNSISLDYVDPAGWPLLHREPSLISICLSHALQMGEMIATHLTSDQDFKNQGQSTMIALSILSAASPLLWLQYSQGSHGFDNDRDRAGVYFENYIKLFRSWREAWAVAGIWLRQLEEMRALYRFAYLGAIEDEDSTPSPTNEPSIAVGYNSQSPEYRPSPGDGTPQANIPKSLYALLRLNRVATLDLRAEYQSSVWLTLMQGWPRSGDSDVWDDFPRNEVSYASVNW